MLHRLLVTIALAAVPASGHAADIGSGAKTYKRYCRGCHGKDGRGGAHTFMPHIHNLAKRGYIELLPDEHLATIIREGGEANGMSSYMPAWSETLTDTQIDDVIAFIRTFTLH